MAVIMKLNFEKNLKIREKFPTKSTKIPQKSCKILL